MSRLRGAVRDLRDRRLLPLAVLLLIAIVTVPLVLRNDPEPVPVPAPPPSATPATAPGPTPAVEDHGARDTEPQGSPKDPFRPKGSATGEQGVPPSRPTGALPRTIRPVRTRPPSTSAPSRGSAPSRATPGRTPDTPPRMVTAYRPTVRFVLDGKTQTKAAPARYEPFPASANPSVLFYGATEDGGRVVFLLGPASAPREGGTCRPSRKECRLLELGPRRSALIQTATPRGVRFSRLRVDSIQRVRLAESAARQDAQRDSDLGRCVAGPAAAFEYSDAGVLTLAGPDPRACRRLLRRAGP